MQIEEPSHSPKNSTVFEVMVRYSINRIIKILLVLIIRGISY